MKYEANRTPYFSLLIVVHRLTPPQGIENNAEIQIEAEIETRIEANIGLDSQLLHTKTSRCKTVARHIERLIMRHAVSQLEATLTKASMLADIVQVATCTAAFRDQITCSLDVIVRCD